MIGLVNNSEFLNFIQEGGKKAKKANKSKKGKTSKRGSKKRKGTRRRHKKH